jgi:hypothetical protein
MIIVKGGVRKVEISAVVTRKDGTKEDHGVIASHERPDRKGWLDRIRRLINDVTCH